MGKVIRVEVVERFIGEIFRNFDIVMDLQRRIDERDGFELGDLFDPKGASRDLQKDLLLKVRGRALEPLFFLRKEWRDMIRLDLPLQQHNPRQTLVLKVRKRVLARLEAD